MRGISRTGTHPYTSDFGLLRFSVQRFTGGLVLLDEGCCAGGLSPGYVRECLKAASQGMHRSVILRERFEERAPEKDTDQMALVLGAPL